MQRIYSELVKELDSNIPREAVSQRQGGGRSLSYLEGWYVIDRLNQTVGQGNWSYEALDIAKVFDTVVKKPNSNQEGRGVAYNAKVRLSVRIGDNYVHFVDVGSGKGIDYGNGLEADESAVKEAVTDGLKRCAKNLGRSMGLALYDKSQEYVDDEATKSSYTAGRQVNVRNEEVAKTVTATPVAPKVRPGGQEQSELAEAVRTQFRVAEKQKKLTKDAFEERLKSTYQSGKLSELTADQMKAELNYLTQITG